MRTSKIAYCDYSGGALNFVLGCTPVSAGCANCYARRIYDRFGNDFSKVTMYPEKLERLLKWRPKPPYKRGPGSRPLAFVVDMGDLFHEDVPHDFIQAAFEMMRQRADIDWQVLTKRSERMTRVLRDWPGCENVWLGVSVEHENYLWRIRHLLNTPAAVRWVSYEPALGPVDFSPYLGQVHVDDLGVSPQDNWDYWRRGLDWIVVGAESGPKCRPFDPKWAWYALEQCRQWKIPCFLKQDSGRGPGVPLLDRQGNEVKEWPSTDW